MTVPKWGVIGFGQAGSAFASHLAGRSEGPITVTDPVLNRDCLPDAVRERMHDLPIVVVPTIREVLDRSDVVLSLVTAAVATDVAEDAARVEWPGILLDFNSVSPTEKQRAAGLFPRGSYVDGAVLGNVSRPTVKAQLAVSGPRAEEARGFLQAAGFNVMVAGTKVGRASAVKMCRSIFMKGVECLFVETMLAARDFDVSEVVLDSIEETFSSLGVRGTAEMLITTHAVHSGRRADEMHHVVSMLEAVGLESDMSAASAQVLLRSTSSGLPSFTQGMVPQRWEDVIAYLAQARAGGEQG